MELDGMEGGEEQGGDRKKARSWMGWKVERIREEIGRGNHGQNIWYEKLFSIEKKKIYF